MKKVLFIFAMTALVVACTSKPKTTTVATSVIENIIDTASVDTLNLDSCAKD